MKRTVIMVLSLLLVIVFLVACAPKAAPAPVPQAPAPAALSPGAAPAPVAKAPAKPAWQEEWDRVVEAAKKEGKLVFASSQGGEVRADLSEAFKREYGISTESIGGRGSQIVVKVLAERRAGIYLYDVYIAGANTPYTSLKPGGHLLPLDPLFILPELKDPELIKKTFYQGKLWWVDQDNMLLAVTLTPEVAMVVNTSLVKPGEVKSWRDLLDPKWAGKVIMGDPTGPGAGLALADAMSGIMGWDLLKEIADKTKPIVMRDERLAVDWLARGKVALAIAPKTDVVVEYRKAGAPLEWLTPVEGSWLESGSGNISRLKNPPHPSAAHLFVNWFLSKEGQDVYIVPSGAQSTRLDTSTAHLPPQLIRDPNVKYWVRDRDEVIAKGPETSKRAKDIFGHLVQ